jgi:hypothetical protein
MRMRPRNFIVFSLLLLTAVAAAGMEDSSFVYDIFAGEPSCAVIQKRLAHLPLRKTVLLSVEDGPELVLDRPSGIKQLRCAVAALQRGSHEIKALMLQDISFLKNAEEAVRRVGEVAQLSPRAIHGVVVDIEPYVDETWDCGSPTQRRATATQYIALLQAIRTAARPMKLEAVVPWWYAAMKDVPELQPASLYGATDGIYAMVYGDPGGPVVDGNAQKILEHLPMNSPFFKKGKLYVAVATYEARSAQHLNNEIEILRAQYKGAQGFAGVSVFRAGGPYAAPLVRSLLGSVIDLKGAGLPAALVQFTTTRTETNSCGHFGLRDMDRDEGDLIVSKPGFRTVSQPVQLAPPGQERDLPPIRLTPK